MSSHARTLSFARDAFGDYVSEDGRFTIRKYERRYNLRRVFVDRGWALYDRGKVVTRLSTLRAAKEAALAAVGEE